MKAIRIHTPGDESALKLEDVAVPEPAVGQALVQHEAIGVNYIDIYFRQGLYKAPENPYGIGMEGAGTVVRVGEGVTNVKPGDRVAYAMQRGSYAEQSVVPAWMLVPVPELMDSKTAASLMLQGMTVHYLVHDSFKLKRGDTCVVHAAAGALGLLLVQVAKMTGAMVVGTASTPERQARAKQFGADHVCGYEDFVKLTKDVTGGKGADVVYDSVGATTFLPSLDCIRPRGTMVTFGNASGPVPAIEPLVLSQKGSLFLTRPTLATHCATRDEVLGRAFDVFSWKMVRGLKLVIDREYPLADAASAHRDLASRRTSGKLLLIP
jgi:NADPH2:quinone reductase